MAALDQTKVVQMPTMSVRGELRLIPPLAEEFTVYGNAETVERARRWALGWHYLLAQGVPPCAHGLYLMDSCPGHACWDLPDLDHVNLWVPGEIGDPIRGRPFLLAHPYADEIGPETRAYAAAHGLHVEASDDDVDDPSRDNWYGGRTLPIRLAVWSSWPLWPIEAEAAAILTAYPQAWLGEEGE
jgi:hypothetical protein